MDDVEITWAADDEMTALLARSKEDYVESLQSRRGLSLQEAWVKAGRDTDGMVPQGARTPGMVLRSARRRDRMVGAVCNTGAIALYDALGFRVTAQQMTRAITE